MSGILLDDYYIPQNLTMISRKKLCEISILMVLLLFFLATVDFSSFEFRNLVQYRSVDFIGSAESILRGQSPDGADRKNFEGTIDDIINLVNQERNKRGKEALSKSEKLCQSAGMKAEDMRDKAYFDHVTPDGMQFWIFVEKSGYKYKTVGENLAEGYFSAEEVHQAWMESEGHRSNILSDDFAEIGLAVIPFEYEGEKSYMAVQHFAAALEKEDLVAKTVCDRRAKQYCETAENRLDEIQDTIDQQEKIIKKAKKEGADKKALKKAEDNLKDLEEIEDDMKDYLDQCREYIKQCDSWQ